MSFMGRWVAAAWGLAVFIMLAVLVLMRGPVTAELASGNMLTTAPDLEPRVVVRETAESHFVPPPVEVGVELLAPSEPECVRRVPLDALYVEPGASDYQLRWTVFDAEGGRVVRPHTMGSMVRLVADRPSLEGPMLESGRPYRVEVEAIDPSGHVSPPVELTLVLPPQPRPLTWTCSLVCCFIPVLLLCAGWSAVKARPSRIAYALALIAGGVGLALGEDAAVVALSGAIAGGALEALVHVRASRLRVWSGVPARERWVLAPSPESGTVVLAWLERSSGAGPYRSCSQVVSTSVSGTPDEVRHALNARARTHGVYIAYASTLAASLFFLLQA